MLNLNLGSFVDVVAHPDWLNIDILPLGLMLPKTVRFLQADLSGGLPDTIAAGSVDLIRMSHLIEHITLDQAKRLLRSCHQALKPGGLLRIATPDAGIHKPSGNRLRVRPWPSDRCKWDVEWQDWDGAKWHHVFTGHMEEALETAETLMRLKPRGVQPL